MTGWQLQLVVEDPAEGMAWAISARDAACIATIRVFAASECFVHGPPHGHSVHETLG